MKNIKCIFVWVFITTNISVQEKVYGADWKSLTQRLLEGSRRSECAFLENTSRPCDCIGSTFALSNDFPIICADERVIFNSVFSMLLISVFTYINFTQGPLKYLVIFHKTQHPFYIWLYPLYLIVTQSSQGLKEKVLLGQCGKHQRKSSSVTLKSSDQPSRGFSLIA